MTGRTADAEGTRSGKLPFEKPELVIYGSIRSRTQWKCPQNLGGMNEPGNDSFDKGVCGATKPSAKKTQ